MCFGTWAWFLLKKSNLLTVGDTPRHDYFPSHEMLGRAKRYRDKAVRKPSIDQ
jgi:hypothetical protein